jgi:hypothetical protein
LLLRFSVVAPHSATLGTFVWIADMLGRLVFGYITRSRLLTVKQDPAHAAPAWLISGVATLNIAALKHAAARASGQTPVIAAVVLALRRRRGAGCLIAQSAAQSVSDLERCGCKPRCRRSLNAYCA